jgi:hypothetical protein
VIVQAEATSAASAEAEMIKGLGARIEAWRQSENRSRGMPQELWEEASAAAQLLGVGRVARALGLSYDTLKRRAFPTEAAALPSSTEFIELAGLSALGTVTDRHKGAGDDRRNGASFRWGKRASLWG